MPDNLDHGKVAAFVCSKHGYRIEKITIRQLDVGGLQVSDDVKIGHDLSVFRDDEAAAQYIAGIRLALNDNHGRGDLLCDLSGREAGLPKCDGHDQQRSEHELQQFSDSFPPSDWWSVFRRRCRLLYALPGI